MHDGSGHGERGKRGRAPKEDSATALKVGDIAPDFALKALHGDDVTDLGAYSGKRAVVLFFGSYT